MLAIRNLHREASGAVDVSTDLDVHHGFSKSVTATEESHVQAIIETILHHENPFSVSPASVNLHNIVTKVVMPQELANQLLSVVEVCTAKYDQFHTDRLVQKSSTIFDTIHRTNLKTFETSKNLSSKGAS